MRADEPSGSRPPGARGLRGGDRDPGHSVLDLGRQKLQSKGADLLVVNEVGESAGFEVAHNAAVVLGADGTSTEVPATTKDLLAHRVWDLIVERLPAG